MFSVDGYKIQFFYHSFDNEPVEFAGGYLADCATECLVDLPDGRQLQGTTFCSVNDTYVNEIGEKTALTRACDPLYIDDRLFQRIWDAYLEWAAKQ
jgi:hypothetical protein